MALTQVSLGGTTAAGGSNPFALQPAAATPVAAAPQQVGVSVILPNGSTITVGSQSDANALRTLIAQQAQPPVDLRTGGAEAPLAGGGFDMGRMLEIGSDALEAVGGFLAARSYADQVQDLQDARDRLQIARTALSTQQSSNPPLVTPMLNALDSLSDMVNTSINALNTQITAVDITAGGAAGRAVAQFMKGNRGGMGAGGGGWGPTLAVGAAGLGAGLLLSSSSSTRNTTNR